MTINPPERYPSGRLKKPRTLEKIAEAERAVAEANMITVLKQPHRRGNRSQLAENPMGRFCLDHKLDQALYDAADAYGTLRRKWAAHAGAPLPDRMGGSGGDVALDDWCKWGDLIKAWEREMDRAGTEYGKKGVVALLFDRPEPGCKIIPRLVIASLDALAIHQGRKQPNRAR